MSLKSGFKYFLLSLLLLLPVSAFAKERAPWVKVNSEAELPDFEQIHDQEKKEILIAINESLSYLSRKSSKFHFPKNGITHERTLKSLLRFKELLGSSISPQELNKKIKDEFVLYKSIGREDKKGVLFTGYFEPVYEGSLSKNETYQYPLYKIPADLVLNKKNKVQGRRTKKGDITPTYWTRQDIDEKGVLKGKGLELVYLDNPYDVYLAQFQGSVAVKLPDGSVKRYGYGARNCSTVGFSLAMELFKDGRLTKKELLPSIIAKHFYKHPGELPQYLQKNPSYVFFVERKKGPMGALSVFLQGERAISTDNRLFPKSALAFVDLKLYKNKKNHPFKKFVLNQDTGGAVIGPGRCEIFFGTGEKAYAKAADMFSVGQLYFLFLKEDS
ncbi:MAG: hypothetical protein S4CHLAM6_01530 [Chlamydiae bacterium]|nr:hypothetical protein [Chlamydiota bacterium]